MADKAVFNFGTFWGPTSFVTMKYTAPTHPHRLQMDFMYGRDIALQVNPRYGGKNMVLNSYKNLHWQKEEHPPDFPFQNGETTRITVCGVESGFGIFAKANEQTCAYIYPCREGLDKVTCVECDGSGIDIEAIVGRGLPDFSTGKIVYIYGQAPTDQGGRFDINIVHFFLKDFNPENIAMQLSVRFGEKSVVRNSKINEKWGEDEKDGGMPFSPGQPFVVTVVAQADSFEVGVNGNHFTNYKYRVPPITEASITVAGLPLIQKIEYY